MKFSMFLALALVTAPGIANRCLHAQPVADEVGELLTASTICVASISADAIAKPQGILATDEFHPLLAMLSDFSRGSDVLLTFDIQQPALGSSATMHVPRDGASLEQINAKLKSHGFGPAVQSGSFASVRLLPPDRGSPAGESLPADPVRLQELKSAYTSILGNPVRIAILPPKHLWQVYREVVPKLPAALGGGPSSVLTDGMSWAGVGIDPSTLSINVCIQSVDERAAVALSKAVPVATQAFIDQLPTSRWNAFGPMVAATLQNISIRSSGTQVRVSMRPEGAGGDVAKEFLARTLAPLNTRRKANRLKKILLAMHNHESAYKYLPPSPEARGEDGQSTLSWRVHILPFMGDNELALWKQFHLDEPWDSEHNKTLISKMPEVYTTPSGLLSRTQTQVGLTRFLAPHSDNTIMGQKEAISFRHVTDGTSNTIVVVEVNDEHAVPWTAPQDYDFDAEDPGKGLHVDADGRINCALMDGSTQRIEATVAPSVLNALFGMNDGQVVQIP